MMDQCNRATTDDSQSPLSCVKAVVRVLKVAEVIFIEEAKFFDGFSLYVDARKNNALDVTIVRVLIDISLSAPQLLTPVRVQGHVSAGVLKEAVGPGEPATYNSDISRAVRRRLKSPEPIRLV